MTLDGIYVTIGADQLKEKPYKKQVETFRLVDGEKCFFYWKMSLKPKIEFQWVYIVIGNKVKWRARFLDFVNGSTMTFDDGRTQTAKHWMVLIDFEELPKPYEEKRGFQGFRYKK